MKNGLITKNGLILALLSMFLLLAACANREQTGALTGAAAGGLAGSVLGGGTTATLLGAAGGALLGGYIGHHMDQQDRQKTASVLENNKTGESTTWVNPDKNAKYTVTPTRTYESANGPCRDFRTKADIDGKQQEVTGTACRQQDGSWKVVS